MREIKFRAWNKKNKVLCLWEELCGYKGVGVFAWIEVQNGNKNLFNELMQYTGLKDKNGVEIYEGDIVRVPDNYDTFGINAGKTYEIYFNSGAFRFKPKFNKGARGYWLGEFLNIEIIGNIYQNPELLEEK